jgi:hypothetical protein
MIPRLVLDTNVYAFGRTDDLAGLAERGLLLSVSEIAFTETILRSFREYRGGMRRGQARGMLFRRSKAIAPFLDPAYPVALGAGGITRRVAAQTAGAMQNHAAERQSALLIAIWQVVIKHEFTDEDWAANAKVAEAWLTERDQAEFTVMRAVRGQPRPVGWSAKAEAERLAVMRASLAEFWGFTPAMTERLDAHVATTAYQMLQWDTGARTAKKNDGADGHLTQHIAEGSVVVTNDNRLIDIVDRSGTFQAPWVRRLDDLECLPEGLPWGEDARRQARSFTRGLQ